MYDDDEPNRKQRFKDWDCPSCNANNPTEDGFTFGDEIFCFYCGSEFEVRERNGKPRFVEL
jgi:hypothetical protein